MRISHGFTRHHNQHPLYSVWVTMKSRCKNNGLKDYKYYGGRGIRVCEAWSRFEPFAEWALASGWKIGLQIDRIDADGDYHPENCRIATRHENMQNQRSTKLTPGDIRAIRMLCWSGLSHVSVAKIFGVNNGQIGKIMAFKSWPNI